MSEYQQKRHILGEVGSGRVRERGERGGEREEREGESKERSGEREEIGEKRRGRMDNVILYSNYEQHSPSPHIVAIPSNFPPQDGVTEFKKIDISFLLNPESLSESQQTPSSHPDPPIGMERVAPFVSSRSPIRRLVVQRGTPVHDGNTSTISGPLYGLLLQTKEEREGDNDMK